MSTLLKCMLGAARLDGEIYEEVEADPAPHSRMLLAFVVAIKHAMDYTSFLRAFAVCFFGLVMVAL